MGTSALDYNALLSLGTTVDMEEDELQKYRIANFLGYFFIFFGLVFTVLILLTCPQLLFIAILYFALMGTGLLLMSQQFVNPACLVFSWSPVLCAGMLEAAVMGNDESLLTGMQTLLLALQIAPWLCFNAKDNSFLIIGVTGSAILFFAPLWTNTILDYAVDSKVWREGYCFYIALINSFLVLSGALAFINSQRNAEKVKNKELVNSLQEKTLEMEKNRAVVEKSLEEVKAARFIDEKRSWISSGLTELSHCIRLQQEDKDFYFLITKTLVKYVKANQGSLYVYQEEGNDRFLKLEGCYAYERKKYLEKKIYPGEGLAGQVFLERQISILSEIPEDYITISSGLGEARPRFIVICPLNFNELTEGVLEIASFKKMDDFEIEYLEKACEIIASTIHQLKISNTTKLLFEQSKIQTEELRSKEEEMRQNMEELIATQEDSKRKEKQYLDKIEYLESRLEQMNKADEAMA